DGTDHETIEDNLFVGRVDGYAWQIVLGADKGTTVSHNTLVDAACEFNVRCGVIRVDGGNPGVPSQGTVIRDNVVTALAVGSGSTAAQEDYNLVAATGAKGSHDVHGRPRYAGTGGTWNDYLLAADSPGKAAASDGSDVGIAPESAGGPAAPGL